MKKAIVCGGAGFVGSAVVRELVDRQVETWVIVREGFTDRNHRLQGLPVHLVECNLDRLSRLPELVSDKIDVWYQFAWDGLFNEPLLDYNRQIANIQYVMDAIVAAKQIGCKKFVGSGSISQYELTVPEGRNACLRVHGGRRCTAAGNRLHLADFHEHFWRRRDLQPPDQFHDPQSPGGETPVPQ